MKIVEKQSKWKVYVLKCRDGSLYTGITNDLPARLRRHNAGAGAKYTRSRRPVKLVWHETKRSESAARKREWQIKGLKKVEKERLVTSGADTGRSRSGRSRRRR